MSNHQENQYQSIKNQLHRFRQYGKTVLIWEGVFTFLLLFFIAGSGLLLTEAMLRMKPDIRSILIVGFIAFGIYGFIMWIGRPVYSFLFQKNVPDDIRLALRIGQIFPDIKDRLGDAIQVFESRGNETDRTSPELAEAALQSSWNSIRNIDFRQAVSKEKQNRMLQLLGIVLGAVLICFVISPGRLSDAVYHLMHPRQEFASPLPYKLKVFPGNIRLVQGEDVRISVQCEGPVPEMLKLVILEKEQVVIEKDLTFPYEYDLRNLRNSVDYYVQTDRFKTSDYRIDVIQRPTVRILQLRLTPPEYAKMGTIIPESNTGNIEVLKGTRVTVAVDANKSLKEAEIIFENQPQIQMQISGQKATSGFTVRKEDKYYILLKDTLDLTDENPIPYFITIKPDYPPIARIQSPEKHIDLDKSMCVPLTLEAEDDFGISKSRLIYWKKTDDGKESIRPDTGYVPLILPPDAPARVLLDTLWDLGTLELFPEDVVAYLYEVFDNDAVSGPKSGRSSILTLRFPSIYEIYKEVENEQANQTDALSEISKESQSLKDELEHISEELKSGEKLEWEDRKNIEQMTDKQQQMAQKVQQLKEDIDKLIDRMEKNDMLSLETLEKYQELQKMYEEIATPELLESMKKMQEALSQVSEEALKKAMENFQFSQEDFLKSIERTLSLLKRIQIEQKMDEMIRRIDDLMERQDDVNQQVEKAKPPEMDNLTSTEEGIKKDTEALRKEMQNLMQKMETLSDMPMSSMESAMQTMENENLTGQIGQMQAMMQNMQSQNAGSQGAEIKRTMSTLSNQLREAQKEMQSRQKKEVMEKLRKSSFQLLQLSRDQEMLMESTKSGKTDRNEASKTQLSLIEGLSQVADSLYELSQKTFSITPETGKAIGKAHASMAQALQKMTESGDNPSVSDQQSGAMGGLNEAVMAIQESMDALASGGSGLGMEQFFLSLEQMGMQQMMINRQMMDLLQQGRLSLEQQAAMSRIAAEQAAVKKMLEETLEKFGDRSDVAGNLDNLAKEMEEVIETLKTEGASQETVHRQEQILSRLLDAQRSVTRRDYSRKREARSGQDIFRQSPEDNVYKTSEVLDRLRRDILRIGKEGYTKDYQALIRSYFEALMQVESEKVKQ